MESVNKINEAFKTGKNKWNFINTEDVQIKIYIGIVECDVQIFKINGLHCNIGFNYGKKVATKKAIIEKLTEHYNKIN